MQSPHLVAAFFAKGGMQASLTARKQATDPLLQAVQFVKGVGERRARALAKVGIRTVWDLLYYFPRRHIDRSNVAKIRDAALDTDVTVVGKVQSCGIERGRRQRFVLYLFDGTGFLTCVWFNRVSLWPKIFSPGDTVAFSGKIAEYRGSRQMVHPDFDRLGDDGEAGFLNTGIIIPLYPSGEALSSAGLDSRGFRRIIRRVLDDYGKYVPETLPGSVVQRRRLVGHRQALHDIHFPPDWKRLRAAERRLKFEELFYMELVLAQRKRVLQAQQRGIGFQAVGHRTRKLIEKLPFDLTDSQKAVLRQIREDMKASAPMNRLLQGDVGSGKTVVATITMLMAVENGYQAALMAPTEILAEQHYLTLHRQLEDLGVSVCLLVGGQPAQLRQEILQAIESGEADIIIGTHALIQEKVDFSRLGLIVIDEQHRFGVMQRAALMEKGLNPDVLVMTATPIPRSLSMTLYGDLDLSVIDEMPAGRKPVKTVWRYEDKRREIYEYVRLRVEAGEQAYVVFPLVEESEKVDLKAAVESYKKLVSGPFSQVEVGLLHGRLRSEEKEKIMADFKAGRIRVLVSTTVIEVGVDVPNASIMVVENAERFGLTQLHQLRGRVGRGSKQSYCILIASRKLTPEARRRLDTMARTNNGFEIAEEDLRLRGPGEFFGTRQHGLPNLRIADIVADAELLTAAREEAFGLSEAEVNELVQSTLPARVQFFEQYKETLDLIRVG
jgi:ATP-dependent DNA helicase RecG